jgi:LysR substrate binding domain-containing protein
MAHGALRDAQLLGGAREADAFDRIAMGTERLMQRQSSGMLTVSTSPDFAAKWLVHRLGRFAEAHPEIDLRVNAKPSARSAIILANTGSTSSGPDISAGHNEIPKTWAAFS